MQKRKNKATIKAGNGGNNGSTVQFLRPIWLFTLLSFLLPLVAAAVLHLVNARTTNQQQLEATSQQLVDIQVAALAQFVTDQGSYLQFLSQRPDVVKALQDNDTLALRTLESEYSSVYPNAIRLKLVPLSKMGTAAQDFPGHRLNSIETAMLIRATRDKPVVPEAYKEGGQNVITLLQKVGSKAMGIDGAILLSIDSRAFVDIMDQLSAGRGQLTLQHLLGDETLNLYQRGEATPGAPVVYRKFPENPGWRLAFQASPELVAANRSPAVLPWLLLGSTSLVLLGYGFWLYRRLRTRLEAEFEELKNYLGKLKAGERALPPALKLDHLTELGGMAFEISQLPPVAGKPSLTDAAATAQLGEKMSGRKANKIQGFENYAEEVDEPEAKDQLPLKPIDPGIFRAYDIRGIVGEDLTPDAVYQIGMAVGSEAQENGEDSVVIARDGRISSAELARELARGLQDSGVNVIDLGLAPTPILYFATCQLNTASGVMVTGSHNPANYNGLKIVIGGETLFDSGITRLRDRINQRNLRSGNGNYSTTDIAAQYIEYVLGDIAVAQPLKLVVDCGNGAAGVLAPQLFEELGCEVIPLYCEVDGTFPHHHPDPSVPANLADLLLQVEEHEADLGIAFDGDGDRLGVVSSGGTIIPADKLLMLFAQDVVSRNPGCDVIFDVKCTRHLNDVIASYGGRPIMWKSGHSMIKHKMLETGALLGGEFSGHIFFKERWFGFDDALYSAARLIEIMSTGNPDLDELLEQFPTSFGTPELFVEVGDEAKFDIVKLFAEQADFGEAKLSLIDGVRADFPEGWGLLRASNTNPCLVLRFEADSESALAQIIQRFQAELDLIMPGLQIPQ